ncbi:MAG: peptidylprolyl isomerase [Myxococcota bacterium]
MHAEPEPGGRWKVLLREPVLHFALLGGALFVLSFLSSTEERESSHDIVVATAFVDELRAERARTGTPATDDEALIAEFQREEALVRHARSLGLDAGDPIIRRRLRQKLEFLLESQVELAEPTDEALVAFRDRHPEQFATPSRATFELRLFASDRADPEADAQRFLEAEPGLTEAAGDPLPLGSRVQARSANALQRELGNAAADAIFAAPLGQWSGPISSPFGALVVHVVERIEGGPRPLDEVREQLVQAVQAEARRAETARRVQELVEAYPVRIEP